MTTGLPSSYVAVYKPDTGYFRHMSAVVLGDGCRSLEVAVKKLNLTNAKPVDMPGIEQSNRVLLTAVLEHLFTNAHSFNEGQSAPFLGALVKLADRPFFLLIGSGEGFQIQHVDIADSPKGAIAAIGKRFPKLREHLARPLS